MDAEIEKPSTSEPKLQFPKLENNKKLFANNCGITFSELNDIMVIENDIIQILIPFDGTNAEKQIKLSQCVLTAFDVILQKEWISAEILSESLRYAGISLDHLPRNLRRNSNIFRIRGRGKGKNLEYRITEFGKRSAFELIQKLAKEVSPQ